jgi:hypothetical protein
VKRKKRYEKGFVGAILLLSSSVMYGVRVNLSRGYVSLFLSSNYWPVTRTEGEDIG